MCIFMDAICKFRCVRIFNTARVWRLDTSWPVTAESSKIPQVGVLNRHPGLLSDTPPSLLLHADMSETPCFLPALSPHHPNNVNLRDTNFRGLLICRPKRTKLWRERDDWLSFFPQPPRASVFKSRDRVIDYTSGDEKSYSIHCHLPWKIMILAGQMLWALHSSTVWAKKHFLHRDSNNFICFFRWFGQRIL